MCLGKWFKNKRTVVKEGTTRNWMIQTPERIGLIPKQPKGILKNSFEGRDYPLSYK